MMTDFALLERVANNRKEMLESEDPICCVEYGIDKEGHRVLVTVGRDEKIQSHEFVESPLSWHIFSWEEYRRCLKDGCNIGVIVPNRDPVFPSMVRGKIGEIMNELPEDTRVSVTGYVFTYDSEGEIRSFNRIK